jgi:DNA polymerase-3 subunit alpha
LRTFGAKTAAEVNIRRPGVDDELSSAPAAASAPEAANGPGRGNGRRTSEDIAIGGVVAAVRALKTRKGDRMCVLTLDDAGGSVEVVVFPEAFKQHGHMAEEGRMVLVKGRLERDDDSTRILASEIVPVQVVSERLASSVAITLSTARHGRETFVRLWDVLLQHRGDRRVAIELQEPDRHLRVTIDLNSQVRVRPSEALVSEVEKICGSGSVMLR